MNLLALHSFASMAWPSPKTKMRAAFVSASTAAYRRILGIAHRDGRDDTDEVGCRRRRGYRLQEPLTGLPRRILPRPNTRIWRPRSPRDRFCRWHRRQFSPAEVAVLLRHTLNRVLIYLMTPTNQQLCYAVLMDSETKQLFLLILRNLEQLESRLHGVSFTLDNTSARAVATEGALKRSPARIQGEVR